MEKFFSLQILRAVASTLVLVYHTRGLIAQHFDSTPFPSLFERGDRGVDLFFVLSGFIMTHVHFRDIGKPERYSGYLYSRVTRIYPFVWIVSIWAVVVYLAGFNPSKFEKLEFWSLVDSMMLLPQSGDALVNVTWTLKGTSKNRLFPPARKSDSRLSCSDAGGWRGTAWLLRFESAL